MNPIVTQIRDPKVWGLLFSFAKLLTSALGYDTAPETWDQYEDIFNLACGIAVALGIFVYAPTQEEDEK